MNNKILTTIELEEYVISGLKRSKNADNLINAFKKNYYFTYKMGQPGTYIFSDKKGYYISTIGDRGEKYSEQISKDLNEICFSIYWELATDIALSIQYKEAGDWRRNAFLKIIELLYSIGEKYEELGKQTINEILRNNPYND